MELDKTVPGGLYQDSDGQGWHDCNGKPVSNEDVKKLLAKLKGEPEATEDVEPEVDLSLKESGEKTVTSKRGK